MKGKVEKVWRNETTDGRRYDVLQVNGENYSVWDTDYLDRIHEGQVLDFEFRESGEFKNISRIYEQAGDVQPEKTNYNRDKLEKIIRMSSLRSASRVISRSEIPYDSRAKKTIEIARMFEKYICEAGLDEDLTDPAGSDGSRNGSPKQNKGVNENERE